MTDQKSVTVHTQKLKADANGNKVLTLDSEHMTVTDNDGRLIPAGDLGWDTDYESPVRSGNKLDYIYWLRLLQGMNTFEVSGACTLTIEYEFPRKAGCL